MLEFTGRLAQEVARQGDELILVANSKIGEYAKRECFPKEVKFFSKIDWCLENYQKGWERPLADLSWKSVFPDFDKSRYFDKFNYQNSTEAASQLYQFIDAVFQKEKPDVVVHETIGGLFPQVVYFFCRKYGITYLGFSSSRFPGRIEAYNSEHTCFKYEKTFQELKWEDISEDEKEFFRNFTGNFVSHKKLPYYMEYHFSYAKKNVLAEYWGREKKMLGPWLKYLKGRKQFKPFDYESERQLKYAFWYPQKSFRQKMRGLRERKVFDRVRPGEKFFLYPLHSQPESSTSVLATYFCDQIDTIRNIAFSLPLSHKLYVKEHPVAVGERTPDFYRTLKELPNVVLLSPKENTAELIRDSAGVVTLTSTVGLEAALAGKKVYVLGDVFYAFHPLCRKIKGGFEELKSAIEKDLASGSRTPGNLEEMNIRFLASYHRNTLPGDVRSASLAKDENDYRNIYQDIKKIFFN
ncbi:MAG: hypothetical protein HY443_01140 [Candidatus Nealsonbacteria bacterium]|nr:hypothetical protein [Candidatus Nealsonbacteria bacterium]